MWLIAKTKPNQEKRAKFNLENQGFTAYLPTIPCKKYKQNTWKSTNELLFKGYVFINTRNIENIAKIHNTLGLSKLLVDYLTLMPQVVRDDIILEIQNRVSSMSDAVNSLKKNDKVQIINGAHGKLHAVFIEKISQNRSKLLINILNSDRLITIANSDIQLSF